MPVAWAIVIIVLWVAVICLAVVVLGVTRQVTPYLERIAAERAQPAGPMMSGPSVGEPLPQFTGRDGDGNVITAADLRGRPSLLVFLHSSCGSCRNLAGELAAADLGELAHRLTVVTDVAGTQELALPAGLRVVLQADDEISDALGVRVTPFAIAFDEQGTVQAKRAVNALDQLTALSRAASADATPVPAQ
jgi:methylamine dehydrogenase accessory protein MauD